MGAFLDIEGAFDNTSFNAITTAARERGLEETCCRWVRSMLEGRLVHTSLMGSSLTARVAGCPQGGVFYPLLWNQVFDRLLAITNDLGYSTFGYGEDIIIVQSICALELQEDVRREEFCLLSCGTKFLIGFWLLQMT